MPSNPKSSNSLLGWGITMATNKRTNNLWLALETKYSHCHTESCFLGVHWKGRGMRKVSSFKNSQTPVLKKCKENCIHCQVRKISGSRLIKLWYQKTSSNPHLSISLHIIMILLNTYFSQKRGGRLYRNPIWHKMIILTQIPLEKKKWISQNQSYTAKRKTSCFIKDEFRPWCQHHLFDPYHTLSCY